MSRQIMCFRIRVELAIVKVKYKVVRACEMMVYGGRRVQYRSFLTSKLHAVVCGQLHALTALPREKTPHCQFNKRLDEPHSRS
jgi:hypothetical protein